MVSIFCFWKLIGTETKLRAGNYGDVSKLRPFGHYGWRGIVEGKKEEMEWLWERVKFVASLLASNARPFRNYRVEDIRNNWRALISD